MSSSEDEYGADLPNQISDSEISDSEPPLNRPRIVEESAGSRATADDIPAEATLGGVGAGELRRRLAALLKENKNLKARILTVENFQRRSVQMEKVVNTGSQECDLINRKLLNERQLLRQEVGNLKQEVTRLKTVLGKSLGQDRLEDLLTMPAEAIEAEFKGQADLIEELKRKLRSRVAEKPTSSTVERSSPAGVPQAEVDAMLRQKDEDAENSRRLYHEKIKTSKSRIAVLEKEVADYREKIKILVDKSTNDDLLIADLRKFVDLNNVHVQSSQRPTRTLKIDSNLRRLMTTNDSNSLNCVRLRYSPMHPDDIFNQANAIVRHERERMKKLLSAQPLSLAEPFIARPLRKVSDEAAQRSFKLFHEALQVSVCPPRKSDLPPPELKPPGKEDQQPRDVKEHTFVSTATDALLDCTCRFLSRTCWVCGNSARLGRSFDERPVNIRKALREVEWRRRVPEESALEFWRRALAIKTSHLFLCLVNSISISYSVKHATGALTIKPLRQFVGVTTSMTPCISPQTNKTTVLYATESSQVSPFV